MEFKCHTIDSAPEASKETLKHVNKDYGFIPNVMAVQAESPQVVSAYAQLSSLFSKSSFNPQEQQLIILTISQINGCKYCLKAHGLLAKQVGLSEEVIQAIESVSAIKDDRLNTLRNFTSLMVEKRGWLSDDELNAFVEAGFTRQNILDIVLAISYKVLSNYTNHIADTPLDEQFK